MVCNSTQTPQLCHVILMHVKLILPKCGSTFVLLKHLQEDLLLSGCTGWQHHCRSILSSDDDDVTIAAG